MTVRPTFDELKKRDGPYLNAWGIWGEGNEYGQTNLITPESVKRGVAAVEYGITINLNLPLLDKAFESAFRGPVVQEVIDYGSWYDDKVSFNTQASTQWDGFRHAGYHDWPEKGQQTYYGGLPSAEVKNPANPSFGVQLFAKKPITTRAHLLDIPRYLKKNNLPPLDHLTPNTPITLAQLQGAAKDQGLEFAEGDLLIVRTGFTEALKALTPEQQKELNLMGGIIGIESKEEVARWHWENGFAAVATDALAYEAFPFAEGRPPLHEVFLAGWGLPIGELFDLRELVRVAEEKQKWTFLFTSMTLNLDGGVASPANAQVIL
ncbi:uncharacterized protein LOC62_02G002635 [Vanrija pseudolonga]|uniref:Cyclase n=1 Tax=Vanrija pseudolonga TaxID=143232 RepID=A0AAF0Y6E5_9TREE|nr:hypothetical protein LOC62_02G002635 [Vanrija pseudolonga]